MQSKARVTTKRGRPTPDGNGFLIRDAETQTSLISRDKGFHYLLRFIELYNNLPLHFHSGLIIKELNARFI